jgi:hypothetical protein
MVHAPHKGEGRTPHQVKSGPTASGKDNSTPSGAPNSAWFANFRRLAERAAREPEFYEIAGSNVRFLADAIKASEA